MILFVDDEPRELDSYKLELEMSGYDLVFEPDVDNALQFLEENQNEIKILILDLMMPVGKAFENAPHEGMRTGMDFYDRIRKTLPSLPVIIFTNVTDEQVESKFGKETNCWFLRKANFLPYELAEKVDSILKG
jgi:CheY-like chemotaxis protein